MSAIVKGVGDLIGSVMEIFQGIISTIVGMFSSVLNLFADLIKNIFGAAEGLIGFILGEFCAPTRHGWYRDYANTPASRQHCHYWGDRRRLRYLCYISATTGQAGDGGK